MPPVLVVDVKFNCITQLRFATSEFLNLASVAFIAEALACLLALACKCERCSLWSWEQQADKQIDRHTDRRSTQTNSRVNGQLLRNTTRKRAHIFWFCAATPLVAVAVYRSKVELALYSCLRLWFAIRSQVAATCGKFELSALHNQPLDSSLSSGSNLSLCLVWHLFSCCHRRFVKRSSQWVTQQTASCL